MLDLHQSILHCIALMNCTWLLRPFLLMIKNQQLEGLTIILLTMISICMFKSRILRSHAIVLLTMILLRIQFYKYNTDNISLNHHMMLTYFVQNYHICSCKNMGVTATKPHPLRGESRGFLAFSRGPDAALKAFSFGLQRPSCDRKHDIYSFLFGS